MCKDYNIILEYNGLDSAVSKTALFIKDIGNKKVSHYTISDKEYALSYVLDNYREFEDLVIQILMNILDTNIIYIKNIEKIKNVVLVGE